MKSSKWLGVLLAVLFLFTGAGTARSNEALAEVKPVPLGERVASYLQNLFNVFSQVLSVKQNDLLGGPEPYRAIITYDPDLKVIDASLVGTADNADAAKLKLESAKEVLLAWNKKLKKLFGVELAPEDLNMSYFNAGTNQTILTFKGGKYAV